MRHYINAAWVYTFLGLVAGVFYREFTKFNDFTGDTVLSVLHTHYLALGVLFFLILLLLERNFQFTSSKTWKYVWTYHIGLNLTILLFITRGVTEVLHIPLNRGMDAAISGTAGLGHIILSIGFVMILSHVRRKVKELDS